MLWAEVMHSFNLVPRRSFLEISLYASALAAVSGNVPLLALGGVSRVNWL
jgi:hypothetical protein